MLSQLFYLNRKSHRKQLQISHKNQIIRNNNSNQICLAIKIKKNKIRAVSCLLCYNQGGISLLLPLEL